MGTGTMGRDPFLVADADGRASWFLGTLVMDRVTAEDTDGAYSITEHHLPPGYETPYHRHDAEGEAFYVLDGELVVHTEGETLVATPGETVVTPSGHPHGYRVTSESPVRKLVFVWPAGFEEFFHEAGEPAATRAIPEPTEPDLDELEALAQEYELALLGPLPQ